jgi:hypothetical protein
MDDVNLPGRSSPSSLFEIGTAISGEEGRLCPPKAGIGAPLTLYIGRQFNRIE